MLLMKNTRKCQSGKVAGVRDTSAFPPDYGWKKIKIRITTLEILLDVLTPLISRQKDHTSSSCFIDKYIIINKYAAWTNIYIHTHVRIADGKNNHRHHITRVQWVLNVTWCITNINRMINELYAIIIDTANISNSITSQPTHLSRRKYIVTSLPTTTWAPPLPEHQ